MTLAGIITFGVILYFGIHAYKRGKFFWIFLLIFLNWIGILIYFFVEFLPEFKGSDQAQEAGSAMEKFFFPAKQLKLLQDAFENAPTHANRMAYGDGLQQAGKFELALEIYRPAAKGINEDDPRVWAGLGHAHFMLGNMDEAVTALQTRQRFRKGKRPDDFDMLLARAWQANGDHNKALKAFESLAEAYSGEEARCRYALLLLEEGKTDQALSIFQEIEQHVRLSPKHYQKAQQEWTRIAKENIQRLSK